MESVKIANYCKTKRRVFGYYVSATIAHIGAARFEGLTEIRLFDSAATMCTPEYLPENLKGLLQRGIRITGYYFVDDSGGGIINLFGHEVFRGIPFPLSYSPVVQIRIATHLSHELAHHLVHQKAIIIEEENEEKLAERYSVYVMRKLLKNKWFRIFRVLCRELSSWHLASGRADWILNNYDAAENSFYTAWQLDEDNVDASECWHFSRKRR